MDSTTVLLLVGAVVAAGVLGVAVALLVRLVRARRGLRRAGLPTGPRWVFWGAVVYLLLPTDLLPDPVYLDDIGVLLLALRSMRPPRPLTEEPVRAPATGAKRGRPDGPARRSS
ncbi:DUF1232 domain-containing protein [Streptomyces sp. NPDC005435]|uniref:DUF1232 domain-containing protein n=1 Tax=Streptomyces sp. NPDC005435 TaxID=3154464 RepID=UPI003456E0AA